MHGSVQHALRRCRLASPLKANMTARNAHCEIVSGPLEAARVENPDEDMRGKFLQIARNGEHHRWRDFEERRSEILGVLAKMWHQLRDERQRDRDIAAEYVAHGKKNHSTVRFLS